MTIKCELCKQEARFTRDIKDKPVQYCKNEMCLLFNLKHRCGDPLPKVVKLKESEVCTCCKDVILPKINEIIDRI